MFPGSIWRSEVWGGSGRREIRVPSGNGLDKSRRVKFSGGFVSFKFNVVSVLCLYARYPPPVQPSLHTAALTLV